jgi:thiosulfate dehydrogenase [quinone] large subunit
MLSVVSEEPILDSPGRGEAMSVTHEVFDLQTTREGATQPPSTLRPLLTKAEEPVHPLWAVVGLVGLRFALGFEFLWAFLDKTFGLGYSTPSAQAWIHGGSPTKGFLSGANVGPFQGFFRSLAGVPGMDWLFMAGLLGVGLAFILGVAIRPAAVSGAVMLALMWAAVWVPAKVAGGQPSGSTNPIVDEHIVGIFGFIVVGALASWGVGYLGRKWSSLRIVKSFPWLR